MASPPESGGRPSWSDERHADQGEQARIDRAHDVAADLDAGFGDALDQGEHALRGGSFAREPVHRLFRHTLRHGLRAVHEYLDVEGRTVRPSRIVLEHDTARSEEDYWSKLQRYAALWAGEQRGKGKRAGPMRGTFAAAAYLLKNLVLRGGFVDGAAGLRFHWLHARYAKLKYDLLASNA